MAVQPILASATDHTSGYGRALRSLGGHIAVVHRAYDDMQVIRLGVERRHYRARFVVPVARMDGFDMNRLGDRVVRIFMNWLREIPVETVVVGAASMRYIGMDDPIDLAPLETRIWSAEVKAQWELRLEERLAAALNEERNHRRQSFADLLPVVVDFRGVDWGAVGYDRTAMSTAHDAHAATLTLADIERVRREIDQYVGFGNFAPVHLDESRDSAARKKARELLLRCLTAAQRDEYERRGQFSVEVEVEVSRGRLSRNWQRRTLIIYNGRTNNVGDGVARYCAGPDGRIPMEDFLLGQKLMLENDPAAFFAKANYCGDWRDKIRAEDVRPVNKPAAKPDKRLVPHKKGKEREWCFV